MNTDAGVPTEPKQTKGGDADESGNGRPSLRPDVTTGGEDAHHTSPPERTPHDSEVKPRARTSDPETSHEAAASMVEGAGRQREIVYAYLATTTRRLTADDIDKYLANLNPAWPRTTAGRRLPELEALGLVERLEEKRPTRSGRKAFLWRAVPGLHRGDDTTTIVP